MSVGEGLLAPYTRSAKAGSRSLCAAAAALLLLLLLLWGDASVVAGFRGLMLELP